MSAVRILKSINTFPSNNHALGWPKAQLLPGLVLLCPHPPHQQVIDLFTLDVRTNIESKLVFAARKAAERTQSGLADEGERVRDLPAQDGGDEGDVDEEFGLGHS